MSVGNYVFINKLHELYFSRHHNSRNNHKNQNYIYIYVCVCVCVCVCVSVCVCVCVCVWETVLSIFQSVEAVEYTDCISGDK